MCVARRLIAHRQGDLGKGSEGGGGGSGDGDDGGLAGGCPANVGGEVGTQFANPDHVYSSVHTASGTVPASAATLRI